MHLKSNLIFQKFNWLSSLTLANKILISMGLGLIIGSFTTAPLPGTDTVSQAFVLLLQMTALPFVALSLISGIGSLSKPQGLAILKYGSWVLIGLLLLTLSFIMLAPLAFPDWVNSSFYSATITKTTESVDYVRLFIPSNPFAAFANTVIPSVVLFSVFMGIGLINLPNKTRTIEVLNDLQSAVGNISSLVMKTAPLGVFCIAQKAASTLEAEVVSGLVVYISVVCVVVFITTFIVLPAAVATLTPARYKHVLRISQEAMITAFATGSFFGVLPVITSQLKQYIEDYSKDQPDIALIPEIIVPMSFSLPTGGKLLSIVFILFAAWFSGEQILVTDYNTLIISGLIQLFGSTTVAMPQLLDLFNISGSMFELFIVSDNLIVGRLGALLSVMFTVSLTLLITAALVKRITFKWRAFFKAMVIIPLITGLFLYALSFVLDALSHRYEGYDAFIDRDFLYNQSSHQEVKSLPKTIPVSKQTDTLKRIQQRGVLRIGYYRDDLPYAFHNKQGKLVGFDIEVLSILAADLGVKAEFVKIYRKETASLLEQGYLDIVTGIPLIPDNMQKYTLTTPYTEQSLAILTRDIRRGDFIDWLSIRERKDFIIGVPESFFYQSIISKNFKAGKVWEISSPRLFFREDYQHIDAMIFGAASASAWTLLYPEYTVVTPKPALPPVAIAFPISSHDPAFELFMRNWILMKQRNSTFDKLFTYWIEGKAPDYVMEQ
ncbi:hypothetical protein PULV_b0908 [Pseudoalteromonas ulvae UL12]|uniref:cation:dicarboxylate symporter family transporter n=1 Tax=Pseudoalteromonas ulvae TaxID=107327 RepID=UPI00186B9478|nr:cation:dicarboxylase symporter family transporter [Pseudoalteromonas ulvae]MBE0366160.1 hypothetical protein [Pseudoalteromonas ulvae UL12]